MDAIAAPVIRPSCVAEMREVALPLLEEHWQEIALDRDAHKLDPDWANYEFLEKAELLFTLVAWVDKKLVGYSANILIRKHLHYKQTCYAQNDVFFVTQGARGRHLGLQLIHATERTAFERGAVELLFHAKDTAAGAPFSKLLRLCGYGVQDIMFSRRL